MMMQIRVLVYTVHLINEFVLFIRKISVSYAAVFSVVLSKTNIYVFLLLVGDICFKFKLLMVNKIVVHSKGFLWGLHGG